jgi:cation diffusion facilitator CzcD-associated flavoprotein CzcO
VRRFLLDGVRRLLPEGYDVDTHFTPRYDPWDQRLCFVPGGDLFRAISAGDAEVVTDRIAALTATGVRLESGRELAADVVVTATGLTLQPLGGMAVSVDGVPVVPGEAVAWKGMMLAGVPNLAFAIGYTNASWTLRVDLVSAYVCRLLNRMAARGEDVVVPEAPDDAHREPLIDLSAGYVRRGAAVMPKQGSRAPWRMHQNWWRDQLTYRFSPAGGSGVRFARAPRPAAPVLEEVS